MPGPEKLTELEEGANVIIRFRTGWELRGEVRIVSSAGLCLLDPVLKDKIWVSKDEIAEIRELSSVR